MPGPKKKPIPRRTYIPLTLDDRYVALPDAIALTVYPVTRRLEVELKLHEFSEQLRRLAKEAQDRKRKAWKARKDAENAGGKSFSITHNFMTDLLIDLAIAEEERLANGPRFELGYERPNYNLDLLASLYANLLSFYAALGSPNIMPMSEHLVRMNPGVASTQIDFGLNNPALTAIQMAAPTGPGAGSINAAGNAFKIGMRSSKPIVTRVATSLGKGVLAGGRALVNNAPRVAANAGVLAVPVVAAALTYSGPTVNLGESWWDDNKGWIIPTALLAGYGSYKYIKGRGASPSLAIDPYKYSANKKLFTWERPTEWERSTRGSLYEKKIGDLSSEWNAAVGDVTKETAFKNKYGLSYLTHDDAGQLVNTPWDNLDVAYALNYGLLSNWKGIANPEDFVLTGPINSLVRWARARNLGRATLGVGAPVGGYFLFRSPSHPTTDVNPTDTTLEVLDSAKVNSLPSDTVVPTIRDSVPPVTATSREELNSLLKDMFLEE